MLSEKNNTSPRQTHLGKAASPSLTVENGLARCVCYYLCHAHCRRVQSPTRRYATSTPPQTDTRRRHIPY